MRRGEILSLTGTRVKLDTRMILLGPGDTKEGQWKRVPIHRDLVYILKEVVKAIGLDPAPVFHDLRHTWKTNARRSGMDMEMREAIMGHGDRTRSVRERYGHISDQELLKAIDTLTFNHGKTEIWLSSQK
jgi:integrase